MRPTHYIFILAVVFAAASCKKSKSGGDQPAPTPTSKPAPRTPPAGPPPSGQNPSVPGINTNDPVQMLGGQWTIELTAPYTQQNSFPGNAGGFNYGSNPSSNYEPNAAYGNGYEYGPNYGSNSGYNYGSNPGYNYGSNSGYNYGSNPGYNYGSNPGYNYGSNPGYNYGSNPGYNYGQGSNYNHNIPSQESPYGNNWNRPSTSTSQLSTLIQFSGNNFTVTKRDLRNGQVVSQTAGTFTSSHTSVGNSNASAQAMLHIDFLVSNNPSNGQYGNPGAPAAALQYPCLARLSSQGTGNASQVRMQIRCNPNGQQRPTQFDMYSQTYVRQ